VALPDDWLAFLSLKTESPARTLEVRPAEVLDGDWWPAQSGAPVEICITGSEITFGPTPDTDYAIQARYYARIPALVDDGDTTWLLQEHPGLYLWGALSEAAPFIVADNRIAIWEGKYAKEKVEVIAADQNARFSGSALRQVAR
jgi:hypothetical protein